MDNQKDKLKLVSKFRPCIDIHDGKVKQIVGGTLTDRGDAPRTNFVSAYAPAWYAELYAKDALTGGHVIMLGKGNERAAREALSAYQGGLQVGGGISLENASDWLEAGASHVIVTSWLFDAEGRFLSERLKALASEIGRERIVVDLSCRRVEKGWRVAMNRWQTLTDMPVEPGVLDDLAEYAGEFLIHAADVEGLCRGIDKELVTLLGSWRGIPMTYAGGVSCFDEMTLIDSLSGGSLDVTVGSALDIFGGTQVKYDELVRWNKRQKP